MLTTVQFRVPASVYVRAVCLLHGAALLVFVPQCGCLEATVSQQLMGLSLRNPQTQQQIMNRALQAAREGEACTFYCQLPAAEWWPRMGPVQLVVSMA